MGAARLAAVFVRAGLARQDVLAVHRSGVWIVERDAARAPRESAVHCKRSVADRADEECSNRHILLRRQGCCCCRLLAFQDALRRGWTCCCRVHKGVVKREAGINIACSIIPPLIREAKCSIILPLTGIKRAASGQMAYSSGVKGLLRSSAAI
eukprot:5717682-Pleurochrysis_carterae.AAC.2